MLFSIVSFLMHPRAYIRDWLWSRRHFNKDGSHK